MNFITPDHIRAHRHSIRHRDEIIASAVCGCFYCLAIFQPSRIKDWVDQSELQPAGVTALCPRCGSIQLSARPRATRSPSHSSR